MRRVLPLLLALAGCAVKGDDCTFASETSREEFRATARDLDAKVERDANGLHITLNGEPGSASSFAQGLIAREAACCPHLRFRFEQNDTVNILHVSADKDPGAIDRIQKLFQEK